MAPRTKKIDELAALLEKTGGDTKRLDVLKRTQQFKRSWVELAEALVEVRRTGRHRKWGYDDFHEYCSKELQLRRATVDKLTISFSTIQRHAPQVLSWDGVAKTIPSYQAVDYFSRAVGGSPDSDGTASSEPSANRPPKKVLEELSHAVFDEGKPIGELRKRFDAVLHPKAKGEAQLEVVQQARASARKLAELLPDIRGLSDNRVTQVERALGGSEFAGLRL